MVEYIQGHHVLSMATVHENIPVSCSLFYLFVPEDECFIFASDQKTEHMKNILQNPDVSAGIHNETKELGQIKGIQIKGMVTHAETRYEHLYYQEYPYAKEVDDKIIWKLKITALKYTDNSLGFGQKEMWED